MLECSVEPAPPPNIELMADPDAQPTEETVEAAIEREAAEGFGEASVNSVENVPAGAAPVAGTNISQASSSGPSVQPSEPLASNAASTEHPVVGVRIQTAHFQAPPPQQ
jgi:hypothetical protein